MQEGRRPSRKFVEEKGRRGWEEKKGVRDEGRWIKERKATAGVQERFRFSLLLLLLLLAILLLLEMLLLLPLMSFSLLLSLLLLC